MSDAVSDSIEVDASADDVMAVISDFAAYPQWQEEISGVEVLETDDAGRGTRVRMSVNTMLFTTTLVLAYEYQPGQLRWWLEDSDQLRRNDGTYRLEPLDGGGTRVHYELQVEPSIPVPGMLRRQAARRIVDGALRKLKRRVES